jgi:hypothetical protein
MRVTRRSHLSRIATDDDWFADPWWEDGSLRAQPSSQERRQYLHRPQVASGSPEERGGSPPKDTPFFDPRLARSGRASQKKRKE